MFANSVKNSLGIKLLVKVLVFSSMVTFLLTLNQLFWEYKSDLEMLEERAEQMKSTYISSTAALLWNYDKNGLSELLLGMSKIPHVDFIEIKVEDQNFQSIGEIKSNKENYFIKEYNILHSVHGRNHFLGKLNLYFSKKNVFSRLWHRVLIILLSQGLKTFIVSLFIVYIVRRLLTSHLVKMAQYARQLDVNNLNNGLILDRPYPQKQESMDELDFVVLAMNDMRKKLRDSFFILKEEIKNFNDWEKELEKKYITLEKKLSLEDHEVSSTFYQKAKNEVVFDTYLNQLRESWDKIRNLKDFFDNLEEKINEDSFKKLSNKFNEENPVTLQDVIGQTNRCYQSIKNLIEASEKIESSKV